MEGGALSFPDVVHRAERFLVDALALEPVAIDPVLGDARGTWKGELVRIETRAYAGARVRWARVATVTGGGLEIGNLLCVARDELALPILGADLVALGARGGTRMIAADLSPVVPRAGQLDGLARRLAGTGPITPGGELPDWCARWFSPLALYVRPTAEELPRAVGALEAFVHEMATLVREARPEPALASAAAAAYAGYAAAHREDDKGLGLLAKIVSPAWAERYLREVLFP